MKDFKIEILQKITLSTIISILAFSCLQIEEEPKEEKLNQITLIFTNPPDNGTFHTSYGSRLSLTNFHQIQYRNENMINTYYSPKKEIDTLTISTNLPYLEIFHSYKGLVELSYLIEKGDTVIFTYKELKPIASSKYNSQYIDLNLGLIQYENIFGEGFDTLRSYLISPIEQQMKGTIPYGTEGFSKKKYQEVKTKEKWLDGKFEADQITSLKYNYYKDKLNFERILIENELQSISIQRYQNLIKKSQEEITFRPYFLKFVKQYLSEISRDAPTYNIQSSGGGGKFKDFTYLFDKIEQDTILNDELKDVFYFEALENIIRHIKKTDVSKKYYEKFKLKAKNKNLVTEINEKYQLEEKLTDELILEDKLGEKITFKEVLKRNRGKVIYVDLWASWCKPCLEELHHTRKLAEDYKKGNFNVVFISKDENVKNWLKLNVENEKYESYRITNPYTTTFFEKVNQRFIPFYLLYDKMGKLSYVDAPRPSSSKIHKIIKEQLAF